MSGDVQVRFCESLRVRFPRATRLLILCQTSRQLTRCKRRMMEVLHERRLSLSRKKTRIGCIEKGFHFLGIQYLGTQTSSNTDVTQANERSVIQIDSAHNPTSLGGGRQILQLIIKHLRKRSSSRTQGRFEKFAPKLNRWLLMGCRTKESEVICIVGPRGGLEPHKVGSTRSYWNGF